jgi:hypothetical protein
MARTFSTVSSPAVAAALVIGSSALAAAQDFTVRMKTDDGKTATYYVSSRAVRDTSSVPVETDVIYRLDQNKRISLDNKNKTYSEITLAQLRDAMGRSGRSLTPEQQQMMGRFGLSGPTTVTKIGAGDTIAGYSTEKYAIKSAMMQAEWSVTQALQYPAAYCDFIAAFLVPGMPDTGGLGAIVELGKTSKGFPLKRVGNITVTPGAKPLTVTVTATSVDKNPIPGSVFEAPAGYQQRGPNR